MHCKMLLFDLDGTLLTSQETISPRTLTALTRCREMGLLIGVATSRGEQNAMGFLNTLQPDAVISSAGALVRCLGKITHENGFSGDETAAVLDSLQKIAGYALPMTVDTVDDYYRNYIVPPDDPDQTWAMGHMTDYAGFHFPSLKICFEAKETALADRIAASLPQCDCIHFTDGPWYKLTPKNATKEQAIMQMCDALGLSPAELVAFGDDLADIGMLQLCGSGIAMGNAIAQVKTAADIIIGSNDEDGIALWLEETFLN